MNEWLSMEEIESRFDSEWVLLEEPELNEQMEVRSGRVLWHSRDRDEVYRKAVELRPQHSAFLYIGELSDDMEYVL